MKVGFKGVFIARTCFPKDQLHFALKERLVKSLFCVNEELDIKFYCNYKIFRELKTLESTVNIVNSHKRASSKIIKELLEVFFFHNTKPFVTFKNH